MRQRSTADKHNVNTAHKTGGAWCTAGAVCALVCAVLVSVPAAAQAEEGLIDQYVYFSCGEAVEEEFLEEASEGVSLEGSLRTAEEGGSFVYRFQIRGASNARLDVYCTDGTEILASNDGEEWTANAEEPEVEEDADKDEETPSQDKAGAFLNMVSWSLPPELLAGDTLFIKFASREGDRAELGMLVLRAQARQILPGFTAGQPWDINGLFLIAGLATIGIGLLAVFFWHFFARAPWSLFFWGCLALVLAAVVRLALGSLIVDPFSAAVLDRLPSSVAAPVAWMFAAVVTAVVDCWVIYAIARRRQEQLVVASHATAFAIGFAGIEAFLMGLMSFGIVLTMLSVPEQLPLWFTVSVAERLRKVALVPPAIVQSWSAVFIQTLFCLAVVYALQKRSRGWLVCAGAYKVVLFVLTAFLASAIATEALGQVWGATLALVSISACAVAGLVWLGRRMPLVQQEIVVPAPESPLDATGGPS